MNLEKMSVLSQKIEGVLGTVRTLKEENAKIKRELSQAQAMAQDKTLLLESAKHDLADCKAALDARANQANAQQEMLNKQASEIEVLNEKTVVLGQQLVEKDGCIESLESKIRELTSNQELLSGQINERAETVNALNTQVAEKDAAIAKLMEQLSEKSALVDSLNDQLQAQNEEIAEAQEKFNQLVATIESELGTDIELDDTPSIEPVVEGSEAAATEETETEEVAEDVAEEPFHQTQNIVTLYKAHLKVQLGELKLSVTSGVLVSVAAGNLEVFVKAADHQKLLVKLRALGKCIELSGIFS